MKTILIDGAQFSNLDEFYDHIAAQAGFDAGFGRNLDALWDALTDLDTPVELQWLHAKQSSQRLGESFDAIRKLIDEACAECDEFTASFLS